LNFSRRKYEGDPEPHIFPVWEPHQNGELRDTGLPASTIVTYKVRSAIYCIMYSTPLDKSQIDGLLFSWTILEGKTLDFHGFSIQRPGSPSKNCQGSVRPFTSNEKWLLLKIPSLV
jgi:hypothetical protein